MEKNKHGEKASESSKAENEKKIKNLISLVILLGGLFVGSLFVDVAQLIRGGGFSLGRLSTTDVFESGGKTWVSYPDPIINVRVVNDDSCESCRPDEALVGLKRILPTLLTQKVDQNSPEGQKIITDFNLKSIPAFVFSGAIEKTDFYQQAAALFENKNGQFVLDTAQVGLPAGKFLELPPIADDDIKIGSPDAKVKFIEFSDFQCPYCKAFHVTVKKILGEYGDKIMFIYKQFPLSFHPQAENASLASECANEQGKFLDYSDMLFETQANWGKTTGTQSFKTMAAQIGLNASQFNQCLDSKKYLSKVQRGLKEGQDFGVSGTPGTFINGQFENGAVDYNTLKGIIDQELSK